MTYDKRVKLLGNDFVDISLGSLDPSRIVATAVDKDNDSSTMLAMSAKKARKLAAALIEAAYVAEGGAQ